MRLPRRLTHPVLVVGGLVTLVIGVLMILAPDVVAVQAAGRWGQSLAEAAGAVACALCARGLEGRRARATWALFAAGLAIWALTDLVAGAWVMAGREIAPPSPFDLTWLLFYVPMLAGLGLVYAYMRPERSWQGMIDAALLSVGVAIFGWVLLLGPITATASGGTLGTVVNMLYPVFDLAGLGALAWVLLRRAGAAPPWLWWVAAAFGLTLLADIAYLTVYANGWTPAGGIAAAGYMAGGWLWVGAAGSRSRTLDSETDVELRGATPAWAEGLPFVCGLAVVLLVAADRGLLGAAVLLALVLAGARLALTHRANRVLISARRDGERRLREVVDEQASLRRVAEAVAGGAEPDEVFALVAGEVSALFGADCGLVWRFEDEEAEAVGVHGDDSTPPGHRIALTGAGAAPTVARTRRSAAASYALDGPRAGLSRHGIASPITVDGRLWGCVHIAATREGTESPFGTSGEERLAGFASLVGLAIANAAARSEMEARALTDPLTGLANRRAFQDRLFAEWERARRHGDDLSLVMIDLDHFKRVNDTHGHPVGDRVLTELARRLRQSIRAHDILARVGGEEFAWVLPGASAAEAAEAAERARSLVRDSVFPEAGPLTASFGVCGSVDASGPSELHQLTDEALYAAKREGRDRVCRYSPAMGADGAPPAAQEEPNLLPRPSVLGVVGLARAVDAKDPATRQHSGRVADLGVRLATAMGWDSERCAALRDAGLMHDVGKIAVPDAILLKPGPLTPEEYAVVQTHAAASAAIVADVLSPEQVAWVRHQHERLDGTGYPDRLVAGEIPEGALILAVADAVDVMLTPRAYGRRMDLDEAVEECRRCAGTQFDPRVVEALERLVAVGAVDVPAVAEVAAG